MHFSPICASFWRNSPNTNIEPKWTPRTSPWPSETISFDRRRNSTWTWSKDTSREKRWRGRRVDRLFSYNLVPLIKVLIDQSDYLFSASIEEKTPSDQHNESLTKSSGFSSVSSLLSSQDQPVLVRLRSSSMPSIRLPTCRSFDSANLSYESPLDQDSFITCMERDFPTDPEKDPTSDIKCDDNYQLG